MRTSSAENNGWRCPKCGDQTTRDRTGQGFVRHLTNRDCAYERGQRDGDARQGGETALFGKWLSNYFGQSAQGRSHHVFYDHGDGNEYNVVAIKGFYGCQVSNLNRLADVDVMVASREKYVRLLIEIEERPCTPKKMLGDIMAIAMCNRFAIRQDGIQSYFDVETSTQIVIAGVLPQEGNRLERVRKVILPRVRQFGAPKDGISLANVDMIFTETIEDTMDALRSMISKAFPG